MDNEQHVIPTEEPLRAPRPSPRPGARASFRRPRPAAAALLALAAACGGEVSKPLGPGETVEGERTSFVEHPTRERLGARMPGAATMPGAGPVEEVGGSGAVGYALPASWTELPRKQFRDANFQAGDPAVECYVTVLGGDAGGLLANVNRWRGQVGLAPTDQASVEGLEKVPMLGGEAALVELVGESQAMTAVMRQMPGRSVFVKMTGPPDLVARERERFLDLCRSLSLDG